MNVVWISLAGMASAQDDGPIGEVGQSLVAGATISVADQRRLGLVTLNVPAGTCSGTLLNRYWVLTAQHCVATDGTIGGPVAASSAFSVTATWSSAVAVPTAIVDYEATNGLDLALLYLGNRNLGPVDIQPLFVGPVDPEAHTLRAYGRGISAFARDGSPPVPSFSDGLYRTALFDEIEVGTTTYTLVPNNPGQIKAGGDSGGPDVAEYAGIPLGITGVFSACRISGYVPGMPNTGWTWATGVEYCTSAPIEPVRWEIQQRIQQVPPSRIKVGVSDHITFAEAWYGGAYFEHPEAVSLRDTNGDGVDDIVASVGEGLSARELWVSLSDGVGFGEAERWQGGLCPEGQTCLLEDVNGDRMVDLVSFVGERNDEGDSQVQVSLSTGAGFEEPRVWLDRFCTDIDRCALADVNGDGLSDVVSFTNADGWAGDGDVEVALSYGDGFGAAEPWSGDFCSDRETCALGDVDGDGRADLISLGDPGGGGEILVALSTGARFAGVRKWSDAGCGRDETCLLADTNADGLSDLVSFVPDAAEVHVRLSSADAFADPERWLSDFCATDDICTVGDVNGDGAGDVIAVSTGG